MNSSEDVFITCPLAEIQALNPSMIASVNFVIYRFYSNFVEKYASRNKFALKSAYKKLTKNKKNFRPTDEVTKSGSILLLGKNSLLSKIGDQRCDRNCYLESVDY